MEAMNVGFSVLNCQAKPRFSDMTCSKFLPRKGAANKWGHRYEPGTKIRLYTHDSYKWTQGPEMALCGAKAQFTVFISAFALFSSAVLF